MNKCILLVGLLPLMMGGCNCMSNTQAGAVGGGAIGAGVGTVIGAASRHPLIGALAGAAVGSGVGAAVGHSEDRQEQRIATAQAQAVQAQAARALPLNQVVQLAQSGQSDDVIINQIYTTGSIYQLTPNDLTYLKQQGVSDRVMMYMQSRSPATVGVAPPGAVIVGPPPPPPVAIGVGVGPVYYRQRYWY
jgi:hypothetical protein